MTNYSALIPMGTGIGGLLAWLLPTHCLHPLGILPPFQRAFRQCVGLVQAMVTTLPGRLLAFLLPTDCLRSLENWPPFQRAFRQSVGNPEAIDSLYDKPRQQPDGVNYGLRLAAFLFNLTPTRMFLLLLPDRFLIIGRYYCYQRHDQYKAVFYSSCAMFPNEPTQGKMYQYNPYEQDEDKTGCHHLSKVTQGQQYAPQDLKDGDQPYDGCTIHKTLVVQELSKTSNRMIGNPDNGMG